MSTDNQIIATTLPADRNFLYLKSQGLSYIEQLAGDQWSNLNESDPGVTILDQLCYALTELGYCNNFDIVDILTDENGKIAYQNQFFTPEQILTTAPVTPLDYRKLVLDQVTELRNLYLYPAADQSGQYAVYLYVTPDAMDAQQGVAAQVDHLLNQHRNLAEHFIPAKVLKPKQILLQGQIRLQAQVSTEEVKSQIILALENYVSPTIQQFGYQSLLEQGLTSADIFNGPQLSNGWITDDELATEQRQTIRLADLFGVILKVAGVKAVDSLSFSPDGQSGSVDSGSLDSIQLDLTEVAAIALSDQFVILQNQLVVGQLPTLQLSMDLNRLRHSHNSAKIGASVDVSPALPQGRFRNISDYYSVQYTFPNQYHLGEEGLSSTASAFEQAQVQQLKGYLMVFDQLLTNEFAQLANVSQLFSFTPSSTIDSQLDRPYSGIPYQLFSPTYYCQPLYQISEVKSLLIDNDKYHFQLQEAESEQAKQGVWQRYQEDPFNQYISGLRQRMESDSELDDRRNRMLDHLLARHGEPASLYDEIITNARWYGSPLKTRIIVKSIYLQNYQLLSYHRSRAYDFYQADKLPTPGRYRLTRQGVQRLGQLGLDDVVLNKLRPFSHLGFSSRKQLTNLIVKFVQPSLNSRQLEQLKHSLVLDDANQPVSNGALFLHGGLMSDGQLDQQQLARQERLHERDFINYSTFELKMNLFLGLTQHYDFLCRVLLLLIQTAEFVSWLQTAPCGDKFMSQDSDMDISVVRVQEGDLVTDQVQIDDQCLITLTALSGNPDRLLYQAYLDQLRWLAEQRKGFILLECVLLAQFAKLPTDAPPPETFYLRVLSVFPAYVALLQQPSFQRYFDQIVDFHWPAHIVNQLQLCSFTRLKVVIPAFVKWHNGLRYSTVPPDLSVPTAELIGQLMPQEAA